MGRVSRGHSARCARRAVVILVDTSVWVDYLRGEATPAAEALRQLVVDQPQDIATCEPIAMELLAGASPARLSSLERLVDGLACLDVEPSLDFRAAASIYRLVRASGHTVRALNDCLIAAIAARHEVMLLHKDADLERIQRVTGQPMDSRRQ